MVRKASRGGSTTKCQGERQRLQVNILKIAGRTAMSATGQTASTYVADFFGEIS
jgi:hypothetical protein